MARLAVLGGIGFGILGVFPPGIYGVFVSGALGGLFLALPLGSLSGIIFRTLLMSLGFGVGSIVGFFVLMTVWDPIGLAIVGVFGGALGGLSLGITTRKIGGSVILTLVGLVGFGVGASVCAGLPDALYTLDENLDLPKWTFFVSSSFGGAIGGALLGAALGFLRKRNPEPQSSLSGE